MSEKLCYCCNNQIPKEYKGLKYCWDCHLKIDIEVNRLYKLARAEAIENVRAENESSIYNQ